MGSGDLQQNVSVVEIYTVYTHVFDVKLKFGKFKILNDVFSEFQFYVFTLLRF